MNLDMTLNKLGDKSQKWQSTCVRTVLMMLLMRILEKLSSFIYNLYGSDVIWLSQGEDIYCVLIK